MRIKIEYWIIIPLLKKMIVIYFNNFRLRILQKKFKKFYKKYEKQSDVLYSKTQGGT